MIRFIKSYESTKPKQHPVGMASTGYRLANAGVEYLVYQPKPASATPLTASDGKPKFDLQQFNPEYFERPRSRVIAGTGKIQAAGGQQFKAPFTGDAVLHLQRGKTPQ